ncbi:MAG: geranylgeranylglycerol-phosphate geranylgeranyltransferase [Candidatus Thalassarchaeaceae archaeon]|jgi:geranylgeranylglycerol-phosphate geranylgeranyltransferase|nr:geranylgeranylglycerol-phosphate geranylgeranyltransferase [Candidatus Thalassarchaeaceae archaeon]
MNGAYWRLIRGGNTLVGASTVIVGALLVRTELSIVEIILILMHAFCVAFFMAAWNAFNDIQDAGIDAINHPERPIPNGDLTEIQAKAMGRAMFLLSIITLLGAMTTAALKTTYIVDWLPSIGIWFIAFLLMFHYEMVIPASFMLKHKGLAGNIAVSALVGIVIVFGAAAIGSWNNPLVWMVATVAMLVNSAREIIKDIEDEEGDSDRETLPKKIGPEMSRSIAQLLVVISLIPLVAPYARGYLEQGLIILQIPAILTLISVKPKLYRGEDHSSQRSLRVAMILGVSGFLISAIIGH